MANRFERRISLIHKRLKAHDRAAALLLGSGGTRLKSRDSDYPYRQNSDFFYLTGSTAKGVLLLIGNTLPRPLLIAPPTDPKMVLWEGPPPSYKTLAKSLRADLVVSASPEKEVKARLRGVQQLFFQNDEGSPGWRIASSLISTPSHLRGEWPITFSHSDAILQPLRLHKDPEEVRFIRQAAEITNTGLRDILHMCRAGTPERLLAQTLEYSFLAQGGGVAFDTIVASGRSAATLHHRPSERVLKNGELLLIDCGASFEGYAADITRVLPVSGTFGPAERVLYESVLSAQAKAITKVKAGAKMLSVYLAAAEEITRGLVEVKILSGSISRLMAKKAYQPYFPHGIGHTLGLDVHDIGNLRANNGAVLEEGMVITIEPGLYLPKKIRGIGPLGIRIEDDVLVTRGGREILSEGFPKDPDDIAELAA